MNKSPQNITSPILTLEEVADLLRVHHSTVYRMIKRRQLPFFKLGTDFRFDRRSIDQWMREHTRGGI